MTDSKPDISAEAVREKMRRHPASMLLEMPALIERLWDGRAGTFSQRSAAALLEAQQAEIERLQAENRILQNASVHLPSPIWEQAGKKLADLKKP